MIPAMLQAFKKTLLLKPAPLLGFSIPCKKNFVECLEVKNCPPYVCPMGSESRTPHIFKLHTPMTNFQILRAMSADLDRGVDTGVSTKRCVDRMLKHGHLLPKGHHGPTKAH